MSLRYDCTKVEVEDREGARQMSFTETPPNNVIEEAVPLVECAHRPSSGGRPGAS